MNVLCVIKQCKYCLFKGNIFSCYLLSCYVIHSSSNELLQCCLLSWSLCGTMNFSTFLFKFEFFDRLVQEAAGSLSHPGS